MKKLINNIKSLQRHEKLICLFSILIALILILNLIVNIVSVVTFVERKRKCEDIDNIEIRMDVMGRQVKLFDIDTENEKN